MGSLWCPASTCLSSPADGAAVCESLRISGSWLLEQRCGGRDEGFGEVDDDADVAEPVVATIVSGSAQPPFVASRTMTWFGTVCPAMKVEVRRQRDLAHVAREHGQQARLGRLGDVDGDGDVEHDRFDFTQPDPGEAGIFAEDVALGDHIEEAHEQPPPRPVAAIVRPGSCRSATRSSGFDPVGDLNDVEIVRHLDVDGHRGGVPGRHGGVCDDSVRGVAADGAEIGT